MRSYQSAKAPESNYERLLKAIEEGDVRGVSSCLNYNVNLEKKNGIGQNLLHAAAAKGNMEVMSLLLNRGHNVQNAINAWFSNVRFGPKERKTPLHIAAARQFPAIVEMLIAKGAEVNSQARDPKLIVLRDKDDDGFCYGEPRYYVRGDDDDDCMWDEDDCDGVQATEGATPLTLAIYAQIKKPSEEGMMVIKKLYDAGGLVLIGHLGTYGVYTPVQYAVIKKLHSLLAQFIQSGLDVNRFVQREDNGELFFEETKGSGVGKSELFAGPERPKIGDEFEQFLMAFSSTFSSKADSLYTETLLCPPILLAAFQKDPIALKMLLRCERTKVDVVDKDGNNLLHIAAINDDVMSIIALICDRQRSLVGLISSQNAKGLTPLDCAFEASNKFKIAYPLSFSYSAKLLASFGATASLEGVRKLLARTTKATGYAPGYAELLETNISPSVIEFSTIVKAYKASETSMAPIGNSVEPGALNMLRGEHGDNLFHAVFRSTVHNANSLNGAMSAISAGVDINAVNENGEKPLDLLLSPPPTSSTADKKVRDEAIKVAVLLGAKASTAKVDSRLIAKVGSMSACLIRLKEDISVEENFVAIRSQDGKIKCTTLAILLREGQGSSLAMSLIQDFIGTAKRDEASQEKSERFKTLVRHISTCAISAIFSQTSNVESLRFVISEFPQVASNISTASAMVLSANPGCINTEVLKMLTDSRVFDDLKETIFQNTLEIKQKGWHKIGDEESLRKLASLEAEGSEGREVESVGLHKNLTRAMEVHFTFANTRMAELFNCSAITR